MIISVFCYSAFPGRPGGSQWGHSPLVLGAKAARGSHHGGRHEDRPSQSPALAPVRGWGDWCGVRNEGSAQVSRAMDTKEPGPREAGRWGLEVGGWGTQARLGGDCWHKTGCGVPIRLLKCVETLWPRTWLTLCKCA